MTPPNGEYTRYREFTDFREEMRMGLRDANARINGNEEAIKTEVAAAIRTMNKQIEVFRTEVQQDRQAVREAAHWHWSYIVSLLGTCTAMLIAISDHVWK